MTEAGEQDENEPRAYPPGCKTPEKPLDLDEIFGFSAARKKLEEPFVEQAEEPSFIPHRVFLNNVDWYHGKYISDFLSDQIYMATNKPDTGEEEEEMANEEEGDEEENEEEEEKVKKKEKREVPTFNYEIIGTVQDPTKYKKTESIKEIITNKNDRDVFLPQLMKCGYIVYDISGDGGQVCEALCVLKAVKGELDKIHDDTPKAFAKSEDIRHFILISTVMTWALTKPTDPDDPELPFTEQDYRKRKPHPSYKDHIALEKEVIAIGKVYPEKFKTIVVCAGITYGGEENVLHYLFRMAWLNTPQLPIIGNGSNHIPLIHVQDLVTIIHMLLEKFPEKAKYIFAVEQSSSTQKQIVRPISRTLGGGNVNKISKEEAFLIPEVSQEIYNIMKVNLHMEPTYIVESMEIKWKSDGSFPENIQQTVKEFKEARGLKAIKIFVHGPPASGKTTLSKKLCDHYKIHYIAIKEVIDQGIQNLKDIIERAKAKEKAQEEEAGTDLHEEEEEEVEEEEEPQDNADEAAELLEEIESNLAENEGRLDENYVFKFFKDFLSGHPAQNQGYVLDGFPKTLEQARTLFEISEEDEDNAEEEEEESGRKMVPDYVISLEASDEFLCKRVMDLPEKIVQGTHYTEEGMLRRLADFRSINTDEDTVLNFFDELEIHPLLIPIEDKSTQDIYNQIIDKVGGPCNYGPTEVEQIILGILDAKVNSIIEAEELKKRQEMEKKMHEERLARMEEWAGLMDALHEEEEEQLAAQALPLRHYLMKYIFPTVTRGLVDVAQVRPPDPIDYLAEFLFKENPEGKMFEPEYTEAAQQLFQVVQQFQDTLLKMDVLSEEEQKELPGEPTETDKNV